MSAKHRFPSTLMIYVAGIFMLFSCGEQKADSDLSVESCQYTILGWNEATKTWTGVKLDGCTFGTGSSNGAAGKPDNSGSNDDHDNGNSGGRNSGGRNSGGRNSGDGASIGGTSIGGNSGGVGGTGSGLLPEADFGGRGIPSINSPYFGQKVGRDGKSPRNPAGSKIGKKDFGKCKIGPNGIPLPPCEVPFGIEKNSKRNPTYKFVSLFQAEGLVKVQLLRKSLIGYEIKAGSNPTKLERVRKILPLVNEALDEAQRGFMYGDEYAGNYALEIAQSLLDVGLSLTPGVSLGKDIYESYTGKNLVSGFALSKIDRTLAVFGVLSGGIGSKLTLAKKALVLLDIFKTGAKEAEAIAEAGRIVGKAGEIAAAASKAGVKDRKVIDKIADLVKKGLPCRVVEVSPIRFFLFLIEDVAYSADCLPGSVEGKIKEILDAPEKLGWAGKADALNDLSKAATSVSNNGGKLPANYITKAEAKSLGWVSEKGNLATVAPGKSIGGDIYSNKFKSLPNGDYREADLGYRMGRRGSERMVYTKNGESIYITNDHYETFVQVK